MNECSSNPCQNSGTCNDGVNGYTCDCIPGYIGNECGTGMSTYLQTRYFLEHIYLELSFYCMMTVKIGYLIIIVVMAFGPFCKMS